MPRATSASSRPALRRNQACLTCRKRKLKCDAARPHCGTCVKQWQATISVPPPIGYAHPTEPQCSYDPVDGLPIAPDVDPAEKIRQLEEQISQLKSQLVEVRSVTFGSPSSSSSTRLNHSSSLHPSSSSRPQSSNGRSLNGSPDDRSITLPTASLDMINTVDLANSPSLSVPELHYVGDGHTPSDQYMDIFFTGWDTNLPPLRQLKNYIEVFFRCDPCGSKALHRPSFINSLDLHPKDPNFPHSAILHAICASASRWISHDVVTSPDGTRRDRFAEFHVSKTRSYIDRTMATGQDIFPVMQACSLLSWYFYQEGRWVEVWIFAGFQTRVAIPLRLNFPGTFSAQGGNAPGAYLAPPKDLRELELRRRTWWMTIMFDRVVSVGGWLHGVDERDIGTEFPLRSDDFESGANPGSNPQDLSSVDLFTEHDPSFTDSFILFLKSVMLFGRVTDFNTRGSLRVLTPLSKTQNPYNLPGFKELDSLVSTEFWSSLPAQFKQLGLADNGGIDTDLYMVHLVPHAATITLHNPYLDFDERNKLSNARCLTAVRSILAAYYHVSETSLDIARLHPFVTICWYLAAVVLIQLCKHYIQINNTVAESTVWGEINVLRLAMVRYGERSPIGTRQEKLLQGLMVEIIRLTNQNDPLGVPLYPFSHRGLFPKGANASVEDRIGAPLPDGRRFDDEPTSSPPSSSIHGISVTPPMSSAIPSSEMLPPPITVHSISGTRNRMGWS